MRSEVRIIGVVIVVAKASGSESCDRYNPVYTRVLTRVQLTSGHKPSQSGLQSGLGWRRIWVESGIELSCKQDLLCS